MVDVLSRMLIKAESRGCIKRLQVGQDCVEVSHLLFANDTILFLQMDDSSLANALRLFRIFKIISSMKINLGNSGLLSINIDNALGEDLARRIG